MKTDVFLFYFPSINGFSSLFALKNINADVLNDVEKFAKEELVGLLADEYKLLDAQQDMCDNVHFFGIYAAKPEKFRLLPGERFAVIEMCNYAKAIIGTDVTKFADLKTEKISRANTIQLSIGKFFGTKVIKKSTASASTNEQLHEALIPKLKKLITMVKPKVDLEKEMLEMDVQVLNRNNKITASVNCLFCLNKGEKEWKKYIQYWHAPNGTSYWNLSNFKRHLQSHHMGAKAQQTNNAINTPIIKVPLNKSDINLSGKKQNATSTPRASANKVDAIESSTPTTPKTIDSNKSSAITNKSRTIPNKTRTVPNKTPTVSSKTQAVSNKTPTVPNKTPTVANKTPKTRKTSSPNESVVLIASSPPNDSLTSMPTTPIPAQLNNNMRSMEDLLYHQICEQSLRLLQATMMHKIKKYTMKYAVQGEDRKLKVMRIDKDGSCLFSSISQQMSCCKPNTDDHRESSNDLRGETIAHMRSNLKSVMFAIKGRILEDREAEGDDRKTVDETDCLDFINKQLSQSDCWGGAESMQAISLIHKVNIMVFNESDRFYFPVGFKPDYAKTVMIAYRFAGSSKKIRNHYDSVAEIDQKDLLDCAKCAAAISK